MTTSARAVIPKEHHEELLGAFNGGFMTEHGYYGMKVDGVRLVKPRDKACTVVMYKDGTMQIGTWSKIKDKEEQMRWYRQAPGCMYENNEMHIGLRDPKARSWGATLDGETVIRRSAVGLNKEGNVLYVGITNSTTAHAIAFGMHHAGAVDVAQLDVNWSYPKFVLFEPMEGGTERQAVALAKGFEFSENEYIRKRSYRDFFYILRKSPRRGRAKLTKRNARIAGGGGDAAGADAAARRPTHRTCCHDAEQLFFPVVATGLEASAGGPADAGAAPSRQVPGGPF